MEEKKMYLIDYVILPICTSILGGVIVFLIQKYYVVSGHLSFFGYPKISGEYEASYPNSEYQNEIIRINQIGSRITGDMFDTPRNTRITHKFSGNITRKGFVTYQFYPLDSFKNEYGVGMIQIDDSRTTGVGYALTIGNRSKFQPIKVNLRKTQ
jgi:hypothetical protein